MSAATPFLVGGLSLAQGVAQYQSFRSQSDALKQGEKRERLRGKQLSAERRRDLEQSLSVIDSIRVTRGLSVDSPTGQAIRREEQRRSRVLENADQLGVMFRADDLRRASIETRQAAPLALATSLVQGFESIATRGNG